MAHVHRVRRRRRGSSRRRRDSFRTMASQAPRLMSAAATSGLVKRRARDLGFDAVGITDLSPPPHAHELTEWLESGMAGTMGYMHCQAARRIDPARIAPGATRAVVVTSNYFQKDPDSRVGTGRVAKY